MSSLNAQNELASEMSKLVSRTEKYEYLMDAGRKLRIPDESLKSSDNLIPGCQSRVWFKAVREGGRIRFYADSDSLITKGIISLLLRVYDNRKPGEIVSADLNFLSATGLNRQLSPVRANGARTILKRMQISASELM